MGEEAERGHIPTFQVEVSRDGLEASIFVPPEADPPRVDTLKAALAEKQIVFGIDEALLHRIAAGYDPGEYVVARGSPVIPPVDGRVHYFFRTGARVLSPNLLADGSVDHHDLGAFELVEEGQLLARRTPPVPGHSGMTVTGDEIPARVQREIPLKNGRGTTLSEDGLLVYAAIRGQPVLNRGAVIVNPNLRIEGDVDYGTGNVTFDGNLEILGEIKRTFCVRVTGNVYVHGALDGGSVEAGGSVVVAGGVRSGGFVSSGTDVRARYIEYSKVVCEGHLLVQDDLMFALIECGGTVQVNGGLVGGTVQADVSVRAETLGSRLGAPTDLVLRPRAKWAAKMREAEAEADGLRERIGTIEQAVADARQRERGDSDGVLTKLGLALERMRAELASATSRQLTARGRFETLGHPKVFVTNVIHPGVRIFLNEAVAKFEADQLCTECYEENGKVRVA